MLSRLQQKQQQGKGMAPEELQATNENTELHNLLQEARKKEFDTKERLTFLTEIFDHLPFDVIVRDRDGKILLANHVAANQIPAQGEISTQPCGEELIQEQGHFPLVASSTPITTEEHFASPNGVRTSLVIHKPADIGAKRLLLSTSIDITDRKKIEEKMVRRANFDELTGLPNRFQLQEHVEAIIAQSIGRFALAFIDIDNFKQINDYYSHAIGDALLVKMTNRIAKNIRSSDVLARIGGDEFWW
jgi:c-di-GMP phosphodiesterase Gmr